MKTPSKTSIVSDALTSDILSGKFKPGEKLPSFRELEVRFGVSSMVLHKVACKLEADGLVVRSARSGLFIPEHTRNSEVCGCITTIRMGHMDNYFEEFIQSCSSSDQVPMIVRSEQNHIENMLSKKPLRVYVDVGSKDIPYNEITRLMNGVDAVYCGRFEYFGHHPESAVLHDWVSITEKTLRHFISRGHKKILFVSHDPVIREFKRAEMEEAAARVGLTFESPEFMCCSCDDFVNNPERMARIFRNDPPTALFARGDQPMFKFSHYVSMFFPELPEIEKIGAFDSYWSRQPGREFSSWHWDWHQFWTQVMNHREPGVEYYQPELVLRSPSEDSFLSM